MIKYILIGVLVLYSALALKSQNSLNTVIGTTSSSYCDLENVNLTSSILSYGDFEDFRYIFQWFRDGIAIGGVDISYFTDSSITPFESGDYHTVVEVQIEITEGVWIFYDSQASNIHHLELYGALGEYDANKTSSRMVSGDFDHDGNEDDIAAFYSYGGDNTSLHVWTFDDGFEYQGDEGWWHGDSYNATKTTGRVVSGDFDRDGVRDDIAVFYDYGDNHTKVHVWSSNGSSFSYAGVWWTTGYGGLGYDSNKIAGRVVSGDFDRDGFHDDICMFYDYGSFNTSAHILASDGTSFGFSGTWYNSGEGMFDADKIQGTVVSGDFDNDGFHDDITALYEYDGSLTKAFVWKSTGSSFNYPLTWYNSGEGMFDVQKIRGTVVSGDFDNDGFHDDVTALYEYDGALTRAFVWKSTGSSFNYPLTWYDSGAGMFDADKIRGKVVSGDFNNDGFIDDITALYDYGCFSSRFFTWESNSHYFGHPKKTWEICYNRLCRKSRTNLVSNVSDTPFSNSNELLNLQIEQENSEFINLGIQNQDSQMLSMLVNKIFPNPTNGTINLYIENIEGIYQIEIYNIQGQLLKSLETSQLNTEISLNGFENGIYLIKASNGIDNFTKRVVKT